MPVQATLAKGASSAWTFCVDVDLISLRKPRQLRIQGSPLILDFMGCSITPNEGPVEDKDSVRAPKLKGS